MLCTLYIQFLFSILGILPGFPISGDAEVGELSPIQYRVQRENIDEIGQQILAAKKAKDLAAVVQNTLELCRLETELGRPGQAKVRMHSTLRWAESLSSVRPNDQDAIAHFRMLINESQKMPHQIASNESASTGPLMSSR